MNHARWICAAVAFCLMTSPAAAQLTMPPPKHVTPEAVRAIDLGVQFLVRNQNRDGSWRSRGGSGEYPVAMTALSGLALLANGNTTTEGPHAPSVRRAVEFLLSMARPSGLIAHPDEESRSMHGHGFALLFLSQVYGMTEDPEEQARIRRVLDRAVELTSRSQSRLGGWLYTPDSQGDEGSVTVTQVQGMRSCRNAGVGVPKTTIDRAMSYLDLSMLPSGGIAYRAGMRSGPRPPITAAAVACWYNAGLYNHENARKALEFCEREIANKKPEESFRGHYFYAHLYMAQVMYLAGDEKWDAYFPPIRDYLVDSQERDGGWVGDGIGKTYGTAVALVILQVPYSYLPILQR